MSKDTIYVALDDSKRKIVAGILGSGQVEPSVNSSFLRDVGRGPMRHDWRALAPCYATPGLGIGMTRATRRRQLPTNHGHAALPLGVTRAYQPDSSSKPPHRAPSADALRNLSASVKRASNERERNEMLDGWSFHISRMLNHANSWNPPHATRRRVSSAGFARATSGAGLGGGRRGHLR